MVIYCTILLSGFVLFVTLFATVLFATSSTVFSEDGLHEAKVVGQGSLACCSPRSWSETWLDD